MGRTEIIVTTPELHVDSVIVQNRATENNGQMMVEVS